MRRLGVSSGLVLALACSSGAPEPVRELGEGVRDASLSTRCEISAAAPAGLRRLTAEEFQRSIEDIFPEILSQWGGVALGADPIGPSGFTTDARTLLVGPQSAEEIYRTALDVATLVADPERLPTLLPCAQTSADRACADRFVETYAPLLYRQQLGGPERQELGAYFDSVLARSDFATAIKWLTVTLLQSPFFVYRSELGDDSGVLSGAEVATQLAYTFSGTTPSAELVSRAELGDFDSVEARVAEARLLLESPGGRAVLDDFLRQWVGYEAVRGVAKDEVENFAEVREAMVEETRLVLADILVDRGGSVPELLTESRTFVNPVLAAHYGFGAPEAGFSAVERPAGQGIGLLAQGSFLASHAHPALTSPVFRGLFVYERLLCGEAPPVPDFVPAIDEAPPANTTRERFEVAHGGEACRSCHQSFEPYGFGLEAFGPAGRHRSDEGGFPINAASETSAPDGSAVSFGGQEELARRLAELSLVTDCVSGQLAAYAYSGGSGEVCLAEEQRTALAEGEYGLFEYFAQLAASPSMNQRRR